MQFIDRKYDAARNWIKDKINTYTWEQIDFGLGSNDNDLVDFLKQASIFLGEMTVDEWHGLVAKIKELYDESSHFDDLGPVYCFNEEKNNDADVVETPSSAWFHYRKKLEKNNFSQDAIKGIEDTTRRILKRLKFSTSPDSPLTGLVIGNVQSGKTANMAALMAMAADNGFNFFLILSGTIDNLREQTNTRLNNDLSSSGCGIVWDGLNNLGSKGSKKILDLRLDDRSPARYFYVCLKNPTRLKNFIKWLKKDKGQKSNIKMLIIDDEADQAGINTQDLDSDYRSTINQYIVNIVYNKDENNNSLNASCKCINYIGYTATPYANVLNESPDRPYSLFPRNFVVGLEQSKEYFGPQQIFGDIIFPGMPIVNEISLVEIDQIKKIHNGETSDLPSEFIKSLHWFYCCLACFRKWNIKKPVSMLIHTSQDTEHHDMIQNAVMNYLNNLSIDDFLNICRDVYEEQTNYLTMDNFRNYYGTYAGPLDNNYPDFTELKDILIDIKSLNIQRILMDSNGDLTYSKGVHLCVDNCKYNSNHDVHFRLAYPTSQLDFATGFIVIGGATLSRGLTIEGLLSTYFLRTVKQADTLMQMGRWFGYRRHYELLPRIWMSCNTINKFKILANLDTELRNEISLLDYGNQTPSKKGIKIKNTPKNSLLTLTSDNKQQDAVYVDQDHTGSESHTTSFFSDSESIENNLKIFNDMIHTIKSNPYEVKNSKYIWKNIDYKVVFEFLKKLKTPVLSNNYPDIDYLEQWYDKNFKLDKLSNFNVIISGTDSGEKLNIEGFDFSLVNRSQKNVKLKDSLIRLGVIRDTKDLFIDMSLDNLNESEKEEVKNKKVKNIKYLRNKAGLGKVSQLIIYLINKDSKPDDPKSKTRVDLNSENHLVGIYLTIAGGEKNQNYVASVRVRIKDREEDVD